MFSTGGTTVGFGGFGSTSMAQPAAGGFESPAPSGFGAPAATTGFASTFGGTASTANAFGTKPASGFGTPAATQPSFGFGAPTAAATPAPAFGTTTAAQTGFGGFGTPSTSFGQPAAQSKPASSFGGFGQTPSFNAPNNSAFGQPATATQQAASTTGKIAKSIEKLQQAYAPYQDVNSKPSALAAAGRFNEECSFKTYMYDRRNGGTHMNDPSLSGTLLEQVLTSMHHFIIRRFALNVLLFRLK